MLILLLTVLTFIFTILFIENFLLTGGKSMRIYADNAATTKLSDSALNTMLPYMQDHFGNPSSLYTLGQEAKAAIESARTQIARCIGASAREITFTSGGSESDNQAIISAAHIGAASGKKHIISSKIEHHAVLHTLDALAKQGFEITLLDVDKNGLINPSEVESAIRPDTCLVSIMFANNEIGTIEPVAAIGSICRQHNIIFHTDAVQAAGHIPIDVNALAIDMLSISAHKFHGPKGIGALYVKKGIPISSIINGGGQERGKRAGTENVPAIIGMASALTEAVANMDANNSYTLELRNRLIAGLSQIPHSILNGDAKSRLPGNINFCFEAVEGESLLLLLDNKGICASSGSACASGSLDPSHVLLALGRSHEIAHSSLRLSINEQNTIEEIDFLVKTITETVSYLRSMSPVWQQLTSGERKYQL